MTVLPKVWVFVILTCVIILASPSKGSSSKRHGTDAFSISVITNGSYSISVNGKVWLNSAPTYFNANNKTYSVADGTLKLLETSASSGVDRIGKWQSTSFVYQIKDAVGTNITAKIKVYTGLPLIIFQQIFENGATWTQGQTYEDLCGGFPGFRMEGPAGKLGYLSYGGLMFGDTGKKIGMWSNSTTNINDGITGGPLALFDKAGKTVIFSPFNNFMSASFLHDTYSGGNYYGGIMGGVSQIPDGHHQDFMLYYGEGVNKAFEGWGKVLRDFYGKKVSTQAEDLTIKYLGYWTDNGAYYYYNTEQGKTYEQTVLDVRDYAHRMNIPYRYFQYDSWWYYEGVDKGVKTWVARPDIFPDGFVNVSKMMGYPTAAHNRYWASDTTYAKQNGGKYDFIVEKIKALPLTKQFWTDLFTEAKQWGLVLYEQDWLNVEFSGMDALLHNLTLGAQWLTQMAEAADDVGIYIQYCMSNPRHAMQSLLYPAVTQARVSNDYSPGGNQWSIGISNIFAAAMGVAPYKDTFWTTETQPGNIYKRTEPNWKLNAVVSTLSTGPVGPSDMIGATNVSILMRSCRSDGVILKPQYPIRAVDGQIIKKAFPDTNGPDGEAWVSYTEFNGLKFANILVLNQPKGTIYTMYPNDTGVYGNNVAEFDVIAIPYVLYLEWVVFSDKYPLQFMDKFNLTHTSSAIPGWFRSTVFGEINKWVPMSPQRVKDITWTRDKVTIPLMGEVDEKFDFCYMINGTSNVIECQIGPEGTATFAMDNKLGIATCKYV